MDLSAFSNENFDVKDWVNATFQGPEAENDSKAFASSLILKLQLFIQEVNSALEETAQQVLQSLPRVTREVEIMRQEAILLQDQMKTIKQEVIKVERHSAKSMHSLLQVDSIKSKMQEATSALIEADNWTTLSSDFEEVFEKGDIDEIAIKLVGMQNSLEILIDVPDYEIRCQKLENLKNQLEVKLVPNLIAALNAESMDATQMYTKIFRDIKRMPQLLKYYHNCKKSHLLQTWRQIVEADPEDKFQDHLVTFYDTMLSIWHSQINWISQGFLEQSPSLILCDLFVEVFTSLEPSLPFCLEAALKQQNNRLIYLIELKQATDRFARSLELATQPQGSDPNSVIHPHVLSLVQTIYSMYRTHIEKYQQLQERELLTRLSHINIKISSDVIGTVGALSDSVSKVFSLVCESITQCLQLTSGCGFSSLIKALEHLYKEYMKHYGNLLKEIRQMAEIGDGGTVTIVHDWTSFQNILNLLQVLGSVLLQLENIQTMVSSKVRETMKTLGFQQTVAMTEEPSRAEVSPFHKHDDLLLSPPMKKAFKELVQTFQTGEETQLLKCSNLAVQAMCKETGKLTFQLVFNTIKAHLQPVPTMKVWAEELSGNSLTSDLPTFSISPQGYITEVGQFLMTLPQHIEPFVLHDNPALLKAMNYGDFPHSSDNVEGIQVADIILGCISRGTLELFIKSILSIPRLTPHATKQLAIDLGYLSDVLEDLGVSPSQNLLDVMELLKASPEEYSKAIRGKPRNVTNLIQKIRRLK